MSIMYGGSHSHHHGSNWGHLLQRFLCSYRAVVAILIVFLFTVFLYYYNESLTLLKSREIEANQCQQKLDSISAQLQVVYEHKSRLEKSLAADREACNKKATESEKNLKQSKDDYDKSQTEVKSLQKKKIDLEKELADLKTAKQASETAVSKSNAEAVKAKENYTKEIETIKGDNEKLHEQVKQLETALNTSHEHVALLQRQLDQIRLQLAQSQQRQQPVPGIQQQALAQPVGAQQQLQQQHLVAPGLQQAVAVPPIFNESVQLQAPNGQVPQGNPVNPPRQQRAVAQPQAEQVALPMAQNQQQQLYAQQQVPSQQQQQFVQAGAQDPVLQHPLGEGQQQLMMARANNVVAAPGQPVPPVVQAPSPVQQQAPPPAAVEQPTVAVKNPIPAVKQDDHGGGDLEQLEEPHMRQFVHPRGADEYDDEETRQRDFDTDR